MQITLLVLHRKESYQGEHAPEILSVVDEWTMDDNPGWWVAEVQNQKELIGDDAAAWAEVKVDLADQDLMDRLYPPTEPIVAKVV